MAFNSFTKKLLNIRLDTQKHTVLGLCTSYLISWNCCFNLCCHSKICHWSVELYLYV